MIEEINKLLGKLSTTNRFSDTKLINPESVLEHTGYISLMSLFISRKMITSNEQLDIKCVLQKAMLHDIEEAITGDIIHPTKYSSDKMIEAAKDYGEYCAKEILKDLPGYPLTLLYWERSKNEKEGFIVKLSDKLAIIYKIDQESNQFGNKHILSSIHDGMFQSIVDMKSESEKLFTKYETMNLIIDEGAKLCAKILKST